MDNDRDWALAGVPSDPRGVDLGNPVTTTGRPVQCPFCGEVAESGDTWYVRFCPSWPDRDGCRGCVVDEEQRKCPVCLEQWSIESEGAV